MCLHVHVFTWHPGEFQQHLHGDKRCHGACVLHWSWQHVAKVRVEVLLIVGGQAQALIPSAFGIALSLLHQNPAISFPSLLLGHHHWFDEQTAAMTYNLGDPNVAEQPLCLSVALQENQGDGELWTRLLEGVHTCALASLPLSVDQVRTGNQQVWTPVDGNGMDLHWLFRVCVQLLSHFFTQRRDFVNILFLTVWCWDGMQVNSQLVSWRRFGICQCYWFRPVVIRVLL